MHRNHGHAPGMGRARQGLAAGLSGDAFTSVLGQRRGHPKRRYELPAPAADAMRAAVRRRLCNRFIEVGEADVLQEVEGARQPGTAYVRIACPSLDDCDIAEARLASVATTSADEWRSGWTALGNGWLSLRVFEPPMS